VHSDDIIIRGYLSQIVGMFPIRVYNRSNKDVFPLNQHSIRGSF